MQTYSDKTSSTLNKHLAIEVSNLSVNYGDLKALKDISFSINKGDFLYIIGPNGGGKSTLIKVFADILEPNHGKVSVYSTKKGYLPQALIDKPNFPITVNEVIYSGFARQPLIMSKKDKQLIDEWLYRMDIPNIGRKLMSTLSGGQKQRVFLIRALISNPELLILDEPTSALDSVFRKSFYQLIDDLNKHGMTIVFVTHDVHEALNDDKLILELDQEIIYFGKANEYTLHKEHRHV